jgi:predicted ATP-grasp superfamily ATP-dependent carboligase
MANDRHIALARFSRYLSAYHKLPKGLISHAHEPEIADKLASHVMRIASELKSRKTVIFSMDEDLINCVYRHRATLSKCFVFPDNNLEPITDKLLFAEEIVRLGLDTPKTMLLSDINSILPERMCFIYKGRSGCKLKNLIQSKGAEIESQKTLDKLRADLRGFVEESEVLVQEKISVNRKVFSCCGLAIKGELRRLFQYIKLRQHPDDFGTGTYLVSIRDDQLTNMSKIILKQFSYTGIFEIEYAKNEDDRYQIIEMNPRTWKSINFATDCGQNLCKALCDYLLKNIEPDKNLEYDIGRYWVDFGTDLPMLIKNRIRPRYHRCSSFCVFDLKDPLPFMVEIALAPFIITGI